MAVHIGRLPCDNSESIAEIEETINMPRGGARYHGVPGLSIGGPHDGRGTLPRPTYLCKKALANRAPKFEVGQMVRWAQATEGREGWKAMVAGGDDPSIMKMLETAGLRENPLMVNPHPH